jgi:hypothetical protein
VSEVVEALGGGEVVDGDADGVPEAIDRSPGHLAQAVFDRGEGRFDGVEVGAIGGQESSFGAGGFDGLADAGDLVRVEIVHDDEVSGQKRGRQDLLDVGAKLLAVDRPVEPARRGEAVMAQGGDEGRGLPVAERGVRDRTLAFLAAAVTGCHVGRGPGLVDEHKPARIKALLPFAPGGAGGGDVRPLVFGGAQSFFSMSAPGVRGNGRPTTDRP